MPRYVFVKMSLDDKQLHNLASAVRLALDGDELKDAARRIEDVEEIFLDLDACDTSSFPPMERAAGAVNALRKDVPAESGIAVEGITEVPRVAGGEER